MIHNEEKLNERKKFNLLLQKILIENEKDLDCEAFGFPFKKLKIICIGFFLLLLFLENFL